MRKGALGPDGVFLEKPFDLAPLLDVVRRLLERRPPDDDQAAVGRS